MEDHNIVYFRNLWQMNMSDLEDLCKSWEQICSENEIPEEVHGEIRTTIGLARLLMNQKLKQFKGLMDDSEFNTGEKEISCSDLQGFWDMVYFEIEKINKCFLRLDKCKNNEWKFLEENSAKPLRKKVAATKSTIVPSKKNDSSKSRALAAKQRLAEFKQKMLAQHGQQNDENFVEIMPYKQELNSIKSLSSDKTIVKETNKKFKNLDAQEKESIPVELNGKCILKNDVSKQKGIQQKTHSVSIQNKENTPYDETSNLREVSATQIKSKIKSEVSVRKKVKDYGKLQCITRSAKKAMLVQQNATQKS